MAKFNGFSQDEIHQIHSRTGIYQRKRNRRVFYGTKTIVTFPQVFKIQRQRLPLRVCARQNWPENLYTMQKHWLKQNLPTIHYLLFQPKAIITTMTRSNPMEQLYHYRTQFIFSHCKLKNRFPPIAIIQLKKSWHRNITTMRRTIWFWEGKWTSIRIFRAFLWKTLNNTENWWRSKISKRRS